MRSYCVLRGAELDISLLFPPEGTIHLVGDWGGGMWTSTPGLPPEDRPAAVQLWLCLEKGILRAQLWPHSQATFSVTPAAQPLSYCSVGSKPA